MLPTCRCFSHFGIHLVSHECLSEELTTALKGEGQLFYGIGNDFLGIDTNILLNHASVQLIFGFELQALENTYWIVFVAGLMRILGP